MDNKGSINQKLELYQQKAVMFLMGPENSEELKTLNIPYDDLGFDSAIYFLNCIPPNIGAFEIRKRYGNDENNEFSLKKGQRVVVLNDDEIHSAIYKTFKRQGDDIFVVMENSKERYPSDRVRPYKQYLRGEVSREYRDPNHPSEYRRLVFDERKKIVENDKVYYKPKKRWGLVTKITPRENNTTVSMVTLQLWPTSDKKKYKTMRMPYSEFIANSVLERRLVAFARSYSQSGRESMGSIKSKPPSTENSIEYATLDLSRSAEQVLRKSFSQEYSRVDRNEKNMANYDYTENNNRSGRENQEAHRLSVSDKISGIGVPVLPQTAQISGFDGRNGRIYKSNRDRTPQNGSVARRMRRFSQGPASDKLNTNDRAENVRATESTAPSPNQMYRPNSFSNLNESTTVIQGDEEQIEFSPQMYTNSLRSSARKIMQKKLNMSTEELDKVASNSRKRRQQNRDYLRSKSINDLLHSTASSDKLSVDEEKSRRNVSNRIGSQSENTIPKSGILKKKQHDSDSSDTSGVVSERNASLRRAARPKKGVTTTVDRIRDQSDLSCIKFGATDFSEVEDSPHKNINLPPLPSQYINSSNQPAVKQNSPLILPPPFSAITVESASGTAKGIHSGPRSSHIDSVLFSIFYCTNKFDHALLRNSNAVSKVLQREIVIPLRVKSFVKPDAIGKLREVLRDDSNDAEVFLYQLLAALDVPAFIEYSNGQPGYIFQAIKNNKNDRQFITVQHLLLETIELTKSKLNAVPSDGLIIKIPENLNRRVTRGAFNVAVIPNAFIDVTALIEGRRCTCQTSISAVLECPICENQLGNKAKVYCNSCQFMAYQVHSKLSHSAILKRRETGAHKSYMELSSIICRAEDGAFSAFVRCGSQKTSPWLFLNHGRYEVTCLESMPNWLEKVQRQPKIYKEVIQNFPILHMLLYQSVMLIYTQCDTSSYAESFIA